MRFKPASIKVRKSFYADEFSLSRARSFFRGHPPQLCALDAGTDTGIIANKKHKGYLFYFRWNDLNEKILQYLPEDVYYDRNRYGDPEEVLRTLKFSKWLEQELVFDVDADNIPCPCGHVCEKCLEKAYLATKALDKVLHERFNETFIVYSGAGFHIHVADRKAYRLSIPEREAINKELSKYPIDPWVSRGYIRLIRMPFTLNGTVSRIVMPVKNRPGKSTVPRFLRPS